VAKHNGQYADLTARPVENQTQTDCAGPLECLPAAPGVPQHFAYQDSGNKPPPTNAG
jgi:hypothetical protein